MGAGKQFTPEFKREAVQLLEGGSRPASTIARELGIVRNQLYKWQREKKVSGTIFWRIAIRHVPRRSPLPHRLWSMDTPPTLQ